MQPTMIAIGLLVLLSASWVIAVGIVGDAPSRPDGQTFLQAVAQDRR